MENFRHPFFVAFGVAVKHLVKPGKKAFLPVMLTFFQWLK
ncbi:Uncharacterised protein [Shigella sonnei]|nr:Uncharacterised protein [Shigella sonnei]